MTARNPIAEATLAHTVDRNFGDRDRLTRAEAATLMHLLITEAGITGDHCAFYQPRAVPGWQPFDGPPDRTASPEELTGQAMEHLRDIACLCLVPWADSVELRYDAPGSMAPMQRSAVIFAPDGMGRSTYDYLRERCDRLVIVEEDAAPEEDD